MLYNNIINILLFTSFIHLIPSPRKKGSSLIAALLGPCPLISEHVSVLDQTQLVIFTRLTSDILSCRVRQAIKAPALLLDRPASVSVGEELRFPCREKTFSLHARDSFSREIQLSGFSTAGAAIRHAFAHR